MGLDMVFRILNKLRQTFLEALDHLFRLYLLDILAYVFTFVVFLYTSDLLEINHLYKIRVKKDCYL